MKRFEVGKTYSTRSMCDYDCIHSFEILSRTAKTVTTKVHGETVKRGIKVWSVDLETFKPFGTYSMCAVITAERPDAPPA